MPVVRYRLSEKGGWDDTLESAMNELLYEMIAITVQGATPRLGGWGAQPPLASTQQRGYGPSEETGSQRAPRARLGAG